MSTLPSSSPRRLGRFGRREGRKIVYAGSVRFPQGIKEFAYWALMGASWRPLGACWRPLGSSWGHLGASWSARELSWAVWSSPLQPLEASGSRRGPARHSNTLISWLYFLEGGVQEAPPRAEVGYNIKRRFHCTQNAAITTTTTATVLV